MATEKRKNKLEKVLRRRITDLTIVLENINDPHNVSAIFRTADAVGISEIHLLYPNGKFPKLGRKSSASANKWVDKKNHISIKKCFTSLGFFPNKRSLQSRGPSSSTRHGWFRLSSIDQYTLLLPPVGVGPVSQCPCDWSCSHTSY